MNTLSQTNLKPKSIVRILVSVGLLVFAGCATYPMGLSKSEWESLSPEHRADLSAEQYRINEARRLHREEAARQRAAEREAAERAYKERMAELRANARYGDIVLVTLQGGTIEHDGKRYPLEPQAFELLKGESKEIQLQGQRMSGNRIRRYYDTWQVGFTENGHTVILNDSPYEHTIHLVDDGTWETGRPKALIQQGQLRTGRIDLAGMAATVRFKNAPGKPERVIIEHRYK